MACKSTPCSGSDNDDDDDDDMDAIKLKNTLRVSMLQIDNDAS